VPLVASWHTNLHEFGARRLERLLRFLPESSRSALGRWAERAALDQCVRFYRLARVLFAPNPELVQLLHQRSQRPTFLMMRGIDTDLFSPARRVRRGKEFVIGYVGRLSTEKNVRMLVQIEELLAARAIGDCHFLIVGEGNERPWLRRAMQQAQLPGVLRGEDLARAYASMDVFVFPSATDTFGNVVLEAIASGVPAIVTAEGGPKFLVVPGQNGRIATGAEGFADAIEDLHNHPELLERMRLNARESAQQFSWDAVFGDVHRHYECCFPQEEKGVQKKPAPSNHDETDPHSNYSRRRYELI
jgi:phosphatidylinositol alpha 1,6-mannosyltransferase